MYQLYQKDQDQIRDATYISDVVFVNIMTDEQKGNFFVLFQL